MLQPTTRATVLTMEMLPVYTTGRRERGLMSAGERDALLATGADVVASLRGGQVTFHGPGQLVCYPILSLAAFKVRPRCYIHALEGCLIDTLADHGIPARRTADTGVWVSETEKIASIGVHLRRRVTSHGVALNVATDLAYFDHIVACGLVGKRTTSMQAILTTPAPPVERVADVFVGHLAKQLSVLDIETQSLSLDAMEELLDEALRPDEARGDQRRGKEPGQDEKD